MPRFNGTGPLGAGPGTGQGMGYCKAGIGRNENRGCGRGFGWKRFQGYCPAFVPTKIEETEFLQQKALALEEEIKNVKVRLSEVKNRPEDKK
ncbi:MAG: hypothetical protein UT31_C0019G0002 [Parcubacteria group bacterium GW2011_GWF2_39_13b]|nr:MAG: hypothetical protein UT31_C0019G0002 [Parcubacteria group bacterium GW2011_GWF2_39_13b]